MTIVATNNIIVSNVNDGVNGTNGQDAITIVLSNENVTLPANALGAVTSYANSNTTISITYGSGVGLTPVASGATLANNQYKVTSAASGITAGAQSVDAPNKKVIFSIASGMSATSGAVASITYTISVRNSLGVTSTVTKVQNFTKAEKGITGDKGIDSYTYIRYSASSNGASMTNLPGADSQYIGTCTTTQATAPTAAGSYVWAKFVGEDGAKGDPTGITRSTTEPATRYTGMLWQYTGTDNLVATGITALPSSLYIWTGSAWQLYLVKSTNLQVDNGFITNAMIGDAQIESAKIKSLDAVKVNADKLSSISADLGDVSAGTVTLMDDNFILNGPPKKYGIYQSKLGLSSSGPTFEPTGMLNDSQMGVANLNKGELRFIVTDYTENLKDLQEAGMSDPNTAFIRFNSYDNGKDVMTISSSGDIVFNGITSQNTPWITLSSGVKYKYMFSRLYVSVDVVGNGNAYMLLGKIPQNYRPISDKFMLITNWGTGTADDRHIQIRVSDGELILWSPKSGVNYNGEISYTL